MRYLLSNLPMDLGDETYALEQVLAQSLGGSPSDYAQATLERRSLDARHKGNIRFLVSLSFETERPLSGLPLPPGAKVESAPEPVSFEVAPVCRKPRVVVVGSGPAGTFCALRLLDYGIEPILLERGPDMSERVRSVNALWNQGALDPQANAQFGEGGAPQANAQFGEGGAGTFSDGKLTTRIGHPAIRFVLETFVRFGADPRILYLAKPHVGTDVIRKCSVLIRKEAQRRGATYRFKARLADIQVAEGKVVAAVLEGGETIPCDALVLAPGHSARDTFEMLQHRGVAMRQKAFAMGVRVEHPQALIDQAQYGPSCGHPSLAPADYKLVCNLRDNRAGHPVRVGARRRGGERHEQRQAQLRVFQFRPCGQGEHCGFWFGRFVGGHAPAASLGTSLLPGHRRNLWRPGHERSRFPEDQGDGPAPPHQLPALRRARGSCHLPADLRAGPVAGGAAGV